MCVSEAGAEDGAEGSFLPSIDTPKLPSSLPAMSGDLIDLRFLDLLLWGTRQRGGDIGRIVRRAGLGEAIDRKNLSKRHFARMLRAITRETRDELWLIGDRRVPIGTFRKMVRIVMHERTLGAALRAGASFYHIVTNDFVIRMIDEGGRTHIWISDRFRDQMQRRICHAVLIFILYNFMSWLIGRRLPLLDVSFAFAMMPYSAKAAAIYTSAGARVAFDSTRTRLTLETRWLNVPIIPDENRLLRFVNALPEPLVVGFRDDQSHTDRVQNILLANLHRGPSLDEVARLLGCSSATLRRRLRDESLCGFQDIKDRVRHRAAVELIRQEDLSLNEIAWRLGFAELSTFHRAFKRWTGASPGSYRTDPSGEGDDDHLRPVPRRITPEGSDRRGQ